MNVFLEQEVEPDKRQRSLELLRAAGVSWIRQELPWEQIEPVAKGEYDRPEVRRLDLGQVRRHRRSRQRASGLKVDPAAGHQPALGAARPMPPTGSRRR